MFIISQGWSGIILPGAG